MTNSTQSGSLSRTSRRIFTTVRWVHDWKGQSPKLFDVKRRREIFWAGICKVLHRSGLLKVLLKACSIVDSVKAYSVGWCYKICCVFQKLERRCCESLCFWLVLQNLVLQVLQKLVMFQMLRKFTLLPDVTTFCFLQVFQKLVML